MTETRNPAMPWMIATAIAVVLAVIGFGWGFMQRNDAQQQASAASSASQQEQADEAQIAQLKAEYDKVSAKLKTKSSNLKSEVGKLENLQKQYKQQQQSASSAEATLKQQLSAAQTKADLATKCAQVMATGMQVIYNAPSPDKVMSDVVKEMQKAADSCQGVVTVS
jgi:uncharacterized protein HemX